MEKPIPVSFEVDPEKLQRVTATLTELMLDGSIENYTVGANQALRPLDTFEEADEAYYTWVTTDRGRVPVVTASLLQLHGQDRDLANATRTTNLLMSESRKSHSALRRYCVYENTGASEAQFVGLNARMLPELIPLLPTMRIKGFGDASVEYLDAYRKLLFREGPDGETNTTS